ncbi:MAG: hypothetical protein NW206_14525 [Hyphomonadaceae bacterium]|nr:hypothetical protein [Hyphomonadaceae bacterium]
MNIAEEAAAALTRVWETMVVLAEAGNDMVVDEHRLTPARGTRQIAEIASDLSVLSRAAEVLAKLRHRT